MSFKIPTFISEYFATVPHEQKQEAIDKYKRWYSHEFTEMFMDYLDAQHAQLVKDDEEKSDFLSKFQFSYVSIRNKAKRNLLKTLLTKMNWEA